ncbi:MAG: hypothetical protein MRY79_00375 [Alphaproteobacteria bacterium]|nr:hypothetical protein [Alphaproteobacteria bacterium]
MSATAHDKAKAYLKIYRQFQLGGLPTETPHPKTSNLARLSRRDLPQAFDLFKQIDSDAITTVIEKMPEIEHLRHAINDTIQNGNRVFFYGCGATGRLSLSIGYLWRAAKSKQGQNDQVVDFMSGGDLAMVHSIESFEDYPEYGARQLRELGFGPDDLLVSCTEGGETPSVIGATEEATKISSRKPFFLYCNPDEELENIERSRLVLDNGKIEKICLASGPQALSGSTRLQASTVLMLAAGAALLGANQQDIKKFRDVLQKTDFSFLVPFTRAEANLYENGHYTLYETNDYGMAILTDTTERAPTFSLQGFENQNDPKRTPSLSYFRLPETSSSAEAWDRLLLRPPVPIEWEELKNVAGRKRLLGFNFSKAALKQRENLVGADKLHRFIIKNEGQRQKQKMTFSFGKHHHEIDVAELSPLFQNLLLKIILNAHSTLLMGRLQRFESNIMTWVKPSNNKLIDRSIRYVQHLLENEGIRDLSYEDICHRLFEKMEEIAPDDSIVLQTFNGLKDDTGAMSASVHTPCP